MPPSQGWPNTSILQTPILPAVQLNSTEGTPHTPNKAFDSVSQSIKSSLSSKRLKDKRKGETDNVNALQVTPESSKPKSFIKSLQKRTKSEKTDPNTPTVATVEFHLVEDLRLVTIPVTSCLLVLFAYIVLGTLLFSNWEGWSYMDGAYFCFISLLTIGFGDFVPGNSYIYHVDKNSEDESMGNAKLISGTVYILLGLAIIAMCLNLMHEKIVVSVRTLAKRLGLIRPSTFYFTNEGEDQDDR